MKRTSWSAVAVFVSAVVSGVAGRSTTVHGSELEAHRGPVLLVRRGPESSATNAPATSRTDDRATALTLSSLPARERTAIVEQVTYASARLEAQLSPLGDDLGDDDALDELHRGLAPYMPSLAGARAFDAGTWGSPSLSVRVAASCESAHAAPDETCVPLWGDDGSSEIAGRARFLAWSAAHAAVVDFEDVATRERCAEALRSRVTRAGSPLALVLAAEDLAVAPNEERQALEKATLRLGAVMAAGNVSGAEQLDTFARPVPAGRAAPWLTLTPTQLVIVPRLSALTRLGAVREEIETASGGAKLRWVHRP